MTKQSLIAQWKKISAVSGTGSGVKEGLSWEDILAHRFRNQARVESHGSRREVSLRFSGKLRVAVYQL